MSERYKQIEYWYKAGMWTERQVKNAVKKNHLTEDEYRQITGKAYE